MPKNTLEICTGDKWILFTVVPITVTLYTSSCTAYVKRHWIMLYISLERVIKDTKIIAVIKRM